MHLHALIAAAAIVLSGAAFGQTKVTIGGTGSATDVGLWVADKKGYFRDEFITFDSAVRMVTSLASNSLDVGAGGRSAGPFNAIGRVTFCSIPRRADT